jgi:DNA-binding NtrC family response regulator
LATETANTASAQAANKKCAAIRNCCEAVTVVFAKSADVKTPAILLLTNDPRLEESVAQALREIGGLSHLTQSAGDALQLICTIGQDLDLAVIDFEHGPHGMTLLSAVNTCRADFPMIVICRDDEKYVEALAYANGATVCLPKPVSAAQLASTMKRCRRPQHQLALVA